MATQAAAIPAEPRGGGATAPACPNLNPASMKPLADMRMDSLRGRLAARTSSSEELALSFRISRARVIGLGSPSVPSENTRQMCQRKALDRTFCASESENFGRCFPRVRKAPSETFRNFPRPSEPGGTFGRCLPKRVDLGHGQRRARHSLPQHALPTSTARLPRRSSTASACPVRGQAAKLPTDPLMK
jgi:hypothetical protein